MTGIRAQRSILQSGMAEKVKKLNLERDYKKYLYFIDANGNVCQKAKSGEGETTILVPNAIERDNQYLYFIDKEGDVARSPRSGRRKKQDPEAKPEHLEAA
jgi:hypothetical protein